MLLKSHCLREDQVQRLGKNTRKPNKKWFDHSCHVMKTKLNHPAKLLKGYPNHPYVRGKLITTCKEYRKLIKRKNRKWQNLLIEKLEEFESSNPKEYWKLIKSLRECNLGGDAIMKVILLTQELGLITSMH